MWISMRKSFALLLVLVFLTASFIITVKPVSAASQNSGFWTSKAPMHQARGGLGVAAVNGKIYAIGGSIEIGVGNPNPIISGGTVISTNEEYNAASDSWAFKASMPTARTDFAIVAYQNKIYCIGGRASSGYTGVNEVYDPATDTWETKAPMPTARVPLQANVVSGKIYLIGGYPNETLNEVYDPATDSWTTKASISSGISFGYASAVVDNKIYVIGGISKDYNLNQIYDAVTDSWSYGAPPSSLMYGWSGGAAAAATTGVWAPKRIYVISAVSTSNQVYDPKTDSWIVGANVPTKRQHLGVAVVDDTLYAIGGRTYHFAYPDDTYGVTVTEYASNEQYTPIGYGTVPPKIFVVSPENKTYTVNSVSLTSNVNKPAAWMGYSLDGLDNVTITGNITLTGLSNGLHNLTVYAKDAFENVGASETVYFTIAKDIEPQPEPFPATWIVAATAIIAAGGAVAVVYLRKTKKQQETSKNNIRASLQNN
jgi:N-acetylneuraminic acid mutarotase